MRETVETSLLLKHRAKVGFVYLSPSLLIGQSSEIENLCVLHGVGVISWN